jgi:hypothetical protein
VNRSRVQGVLGHVGLALFAFIVGAAGGWLAAWPAGLLDMRLTGAGYTGVEPHWDPAFATFLARSNALPFGAAFGLCGYLFLIWPMPVRRVVAAVPVLFAWTLIGALVAAPGGVFAQVVIAPAAFFVGCWLVRRRWPEEAELGTSQSATRA